MRNLNEPPTQESLVDDFRPRAPLCQQYSKNKTLKKKNLMGVSCTHTHIYLHVEREGYYQCLFCNFLLLTAFTPQQTVEVGWRLSPLKSAAWRIWNILPPVGVIIAEEINSVQQCFTAGLIGVLLYFFFVIKFNWAIIVDWIKSFSRYFSFAVSSGILRKVLSNGLKILDRN